ncbi:MAG TPA: hypothetical protein PK875_08260 [Spirochaetota bacterium]|nr:hypothetical protein [Spirochaetota bacterium]
MRKNEIKRPFPWGFLFVTLLLLVTLSIAASACYFYFTCATSIRTAVESTRRHSAELIEAITGVAEFSYARNNYDRLRLLFREKIGGTNGLVAFFVLSDGSIKAHSSPEGERAVAGNIAADEFTYNRDQIFLPLSGEGKGVYFLEYNIVSRSVPFNRPQREFIKRFLYPGIGGTGWLATRAVYFKKKPIGTINFIISKDVLYSIITGTASITRTLLALLLAASAIISLLVALLARYSAGRAGASTASAHSVAESGLQFSGAARQAAAIRDANPIIK